jgi:hypothetical protein
MPQPFVARRVRDWSSIDQPAATPRALLPDRLADSPVDHRVETPTSELQQ